MNQTESKTAAPAASESDKIERFIEDQIEKAKSRPLSVNVALGVLGFQLIASVCALPFLLQVLNMTSSLERAMDLPGASKINGPMIANVLSSLSILSIALQLFAVRGLYRMRRVGIYALGLSTIATVATAAVSQGAGLFTAVLYAVLFYFLWNDRKRLT